MAGTAVWAGWLLIWLAGVINTSLGVALGATKLILRHHTRLA
jgi:hypothetical protein